VLLTAAHIGTYACAGEDVSPTTSKPRFERRPQWQIYSGRNCSPLSGRGGALNEQGVCQTANVE